MKTLVYWMKVTQLTLHEELKDMQLAICLELRDTGTYTIMHACISHGYIKRVKRLVNSHNISYIDVC